MAKSDRVTLTSPSGDTYETADRTEITRLKAHGYTEKKATSKKAASSS